METMVNESLLRYVVENGLKIAVLKYSTGRLGIVLSDEWEDTDFCLGKDVKAEDLPGVDSSDLSIVGLDKFMSWCRRVRFSEVTSKEGENFLMLVRDGRLGKATVGASVTFS